MDRTDDTSDVPDYGDGRDVWRLETDHFGAGVLAGGRVVATFRSAEDAARAVAAVNGPFGELPAGAHQVGMVLRVRSREGSDEPKLDIALQVHGLPDTPSIRLLEHGLAAVMAKEGIEACDCGLHTTSTALAEGEAAVLRVLTAGAGSDGKVPLMVQANVRESVDLAQLGAVLQETAAAMISGEGGVIF